MHGTHLTEGLADPVETKGLHPLLLASVRRLSTGRREAGGLSILDGDSRLVHSRGLLADAGCGAQPLGQQSQDPPGSEEHDEDVHHAEDDHPVLEVHTEIVAQPGDDSRSDYRARERPRAADDHHQHRLERGLDTEDGGGDELRGVRIQDTGHSGEGSGDDEDDELVEPHVVAAGPHPELALFDPAQSQAERRSHQSIHQETAEEKDSEGDVIEGEVRFKGRKGPRNPMQTQIPTRQRSPAMGEPPQHLGDDQGHDQEEETGHPHRQGSSNRGEQDAPQDGDRNRSLPAQPVPGAEDCDRVCSHSEERGLTQ